MYICLQNHLFGPEQTSSLWASVSFKSKVNCPFTLCQWGNEKLHRSTKTLVKIYCWCL